MNIGPDCWETQKTEPKTHSKQKQKQLALTTKIAKSNE